MSMKIRLARGGSKKRPFYRIVAADSRMPRDGRFIERLGTYNPLLAKDSEDRVKMNIERIQYWIGHGAQPTDRIQRMLEAAGVVPAKTRSNPQSAVPGEKAKKRAEEKAAKVVAAAEAAAAPAPAPVEEPAEEPVAEVVEEAAAEVADEVVAEAAGEATPEATEEAPAEPAEEAAKTPAAE
jgi:small subunit ribosomal protein S16